MRLRRRQLHLRKYRDFRAGAIDAAAEELRGPVRVDLIADVQMLVRQGLEPVECAADAHDRKTIPESIAQLADGWLTEIGVFDAVCASLQRLERVGLRRLLQRACLGFEVETYGSRKDTHERNDAECADDVG